MTQSSTDRRRQQVLRIAFALQAAHEAGEEHALSEPAFHEAALERHWTTHRLPHFMNPPDAAGELRVDALRFESP